MTKLMNRTEIKEEAQRLLLNDGAGAFTFVNEIYIDPLERKETSYGEPLTDEDQMELRNYQAVLVEMDTQFERMKKFFLFEEFQSTH